MDEQDRQDENRELSILFILSIHVKKELQLHRVFARSVEHHLGPTFLREFQIDTVWSKVGHIACRIVGNVVG